MHAETTTIPNRHTKTPKVSVCVMTYNQEKYIRQCLQSIVDQETDFEFEVIVSDDCSTDKTQEIIKTFSDRYSFIKIVFRTRNVGPYINMIETYDKAVGEYIAHLDGDDYWLDNKLKDQTLFMDKNHNCVISWTRSYVRRGDIVLPDMLDSDFISKKFSQADVAQLITVGFNSSKMFRKSATYETSVDFEIVDYYLNVEKLKSGYAAFVGNKIYTVYRAGIGIASNGIKTKIILKKTFEHFLKKYPKLKHHISAAIILFFFLALKKRDASLIKEFHTTFFTNVSIKALCLIYSNINDIKLLRLPGR